MNETKIKIDIWEIFMYLIIYSIVGFFIETIFGIFSKGVIESRKSFLYGPFCMIYGIGAIVMILGIRNEKSIIRIFLKSTIIGAIIEYLMSFIFEIIFGVKWWDYSEYFLNIQGRICLFFSVSWGLLGILLIKFVNPYIDKFIKIIKNNNHIYKSIVFIIILFFCIDALITSMALKTFYYRIATENDLNIENKLKIQENYTKLVSKSKLGNFIDAHYNNKFMLKTYPNLIIEDKDSNLIYVNNILKDFDSYYYRLGDAF